MESPRLAYTADALALRHARSHKAFQRRGKR